MISENLVNIILNYIKFSEKSIFLDISSYNLDYSENNRITFEDFNSFLPLAIGINLKIFKDKYINRLTHIQKLNISSCNINILPKELFDLKQLKTINCSYNDITVIPTEIGNLKDLQKFYCTDNKISAIPTEIGKCVNLQQF